MELFAHASPVQLAPPKELIQKLIDAAILEHVEKAEESDTAVFNEPEWPLSKWLLQFFAQPLRSEFVIDLLDSDDIDQLFTCVSMKNRLRAFCCKSN